MAFLMKNCKQHSTKGLLPAPHLHPRSKPGANPRVRSVPFGRNCNSADWATGLMRVLAICATLMIVVLIPMRLYAQYAPADPPPLLPPPQQLNHVQVMAPGGGLLGFPQGMTDNNVPLATLAHIHGVR